MDETIRMLEGRNRSMTMASFSLPIRLAARMAYEIRLSLKIEIIKVKTINKGIFQIIKH